MVELEKDAEDYLKNIFTRLPSDHAKIVKERFDEMAEDLAKGFIEESQRIKKINLSQCKALITSLSKQMPPNIKNEILEKV